MRIFVCYSDIGWSVFHNNSKKESFTSKNLLIFTCFSYEGLRFWPEINQRIREGQKFGYTSVMPILDGRFYALIQKKKSFASQKFPIFTCFSQDRLRFLPEINHEIRKVQKCGYSFVMRILDGRSYAIFQVKNPLHYKNSLFSHVILTRDYDFCEQSFRKYAKGRNASIRLL